VLSRHSDVLIACWRDTLIDAAVFREWMVGIGRRTAYQRIAHLLVEQFLRLRAVGLADEDGFRSPLTQVDIADSLGLTSVHVNRVMQQLRRDGLIATQGRYLSIPNREALMSAGDFDPTYLHIRRPVSNDPPP
jgi:CRP-like cAMP-binding protein